MAIDIPQQIQDSMAPRDASLGPVMPGTGMPVPPLQEQPAPEAPDLGAGTSALAPPPGSFSSKIMQAAGQLGIPKKTDGTPEVGGWARSLVGGAQSALAGVKAGLGGFNASAGDTANASSNLSPGQGAGTGVARTLEARQQRLDQQKKEQTAEARAQRNEAMLTAKNNLEMTAQQARLDKDNQEMQNSIFASNNVAVKASEDRGLKVTRDVPENEIIKQMNDYKNSDGSHWGDHFEAIPTGNTEINGKKVKMYSVVALTGEPVKVTDKEADFIKSHGGPDLTGTTISNPQLVSARNAAQRWQESKQKIEDAIDHEITTEQHIALGSDLQSHAVVYALSSNPQDRIQGVTDGLKMANDHVAHAAQLLAAATKQGDPGAIQEAQQYQKQAQADQKSLQNVASFGFTKEDYAEHNAMLRDAETARHNKADEQIKRLAALNPSGGALGNIPQSEGMIKQIADLTAANPSGAAVLKSIKDPNLQSALMSVAFGDGSVDLDRAFPNRITKGAPGITMQQAIPIIKQINPNFSEQQYRATASAYKDATTGKTKDAVQQYNNFIQHSAEAVDVLTALKDGRGVNAWNTALNKAETAGWGTDANRIKSALAPVRGEIALLLSGGYKPGEDEQAVYHTILSDSSTSAQISESLQQLGEMGTVRLDNINEGYKRVSGKNLPRIIDQKTLDAARHVGVSSKAYGTLQSLDSNGTIFGDQTPTGANAPPPPANAPVSGNPYRH
jgi:hypothetical protein